jgi:enterobactin synthetase component D
LVGYNLAELPVGKSREPVWPKEIIGSISHTKKMACAVVGLSTQVKAIGVDIEKIIIPRRIHVIEKMVIVDQEKKYLESLAGLAPIELLYTVVFSAKESLFKAIFPLCREYFDFKEAFVKEINIDEQYIELEIVSERASLAPYLSVYRIQFDEIDGNIITLLII